MSMLSDRFYKITPYTAGEQPKDRDIIKLNTNECPYAPSPAVAEAVRHAAEDDGYLRLYPDPDARELTEALSARYGIPEDQIFTGVGSDEVLALAFKTFFTGGGDLLFPDITYSFYKVWADLYAIPYRTVPLNDRLEICAEDYTGSSAEDCCGIIFPNPNAPTGRLMELSEVERIIRAHRDCVVIVDEAYIDFGGESALPLIDRYDNLLVVQTFSKSRAMAGLRIGYALGSKLLIDALKSVKFSFNSYTLNRISIHAGAAAVRDEEWFAATVGRIIGTRERFTMGLQELGFTVVPSSANFVFAAHEDMPAAVIFEELRRRKIYVRYFNAPRIDNYLRITIGTGEQMDLLLLALSDILSSKGTDAC